MGVQVGGGHNEVDEESDDHEDNDGKAVRVRCGGCGVCSHGVVPLM